VAVLVVVVVVVAFGLAFGLAFGPVLGPAAWTEGCVDLFLIFVLVGSYPIALLALVLMQPFVSLAVHHHPRNLNIANIQTSPNKKVDNILFLFILLRCVALRCVALRCVALRCVALVFGKILISGYIISAFLSFAPKQSLECFI
jgi:hypothetical protein